MLAQIQRRLPPGLFQYPTQAEKEVLSQTIQTVEEGVKFNTGLRPEYIKKPGTILPEEQIESLAKVLREAGLSSERVRQAFFFRTYHKSAKWGVGGLSSFACMFILPAKAFLMSALGLVVSGGIAIYHSRSARKKMPELKRIITKMKELKP